MARPNTYIVVMADSTPMPQGSTAPTVQANPADFAHLMALMHDIQWPVHVPEIVNRNNVAIIDPFDAYGPPSNDVLYPDEDDPEYHLYR